MTRARRQSTIAMVSAMAALGALVGGCSGATPHRAAYTFDQQDSGIKVDTPALRAFKASAGIAACPDVEPTDQIDDGLPSLTLPCLGGGRDIDLAGLRGPLVLNFWSQTCGPCKQESPLLQKLATLSHGAVRVMGVDFVDPRPGGALAFAKARGLTYPQLADPEEAAKAPLHIQALPYTFFVDADGRIVYTQTGGIDSAEQLSTLVHDHLGVRVPGLAGS